MRKHLQRQSFLGPDSDRTIANARVAVVGLCGGGSHVCQQLAHIGVGLIKLLDLDRADETNRNRMVGLSAVAARGRSRKTTVMRDLVRAVHPQAHVEVHPNRWQDCHDVLRDCTAIFGCVDSFSERAQLESYARRYMVPYIDVGMDVSGEAGRHFLTGQVILSLPGHPCMKCMGFLTDEVLGQEANNYGAAGGKAQVVWPNGVLASAAVGSFMGILTPWNADLMPPLYLEYDGNRMKLTPSNRLQLLEGCTCPHFQGDEAVGDVW
jgi:hypothetical protein